MKQLDANQMIEQLAGLAEQIKKDLLKDLIADLKQYVPDQVDAIEFIESNYVS